MNQLTAIRSFGIPSYCPAKSTRIYKDKWYLVEMQDVETDPRIDYVGLAETSTVYLWPGTKTRNERDSRLNHCNKIVEYDGPVFAINSIKLRITEYYPSIESATEAKNTHELDTLSNLAKALLSIERQQNMTDSEILKIYGNCHDWPGNETAKIAEFRQDLIDCKKRNSEYWQSDIIISKIR